MNSFPKWRRELIGLRDMNWTQAINFKIALIQHVLLSPFTGPILQFEESEKKGKKKRQIAESHTTYRGKILIAL